MQIFNNFDLRTYANFNYLFSFGLSPNLFGNLFNWCELNLMVNASSLLWFTIANSNSERYILIGSYDRLLAWSGDFRDKKQNYRLNDIIISSKGRWIACSGYFVKRSPLRRFQKCQAKVSYFSKLQVEFRLQHFRMV